jgi:hypothetical protein
LRKSNFAQVRIEYACGQMYMRTQGSSLKIYTPTQALEHDRT